MQRTALALALALVATPATAGTAVIKSSFGATAHVAAKYASKFQAYINALEARGAVIRFLGGIRGGRCGPASQHPCGAAVDVCQTARGVVDPRCRLPNRQTLIEIARSLDLFEGGEWCNSDMGHVQAINSAGACGSMSARGHRHQLKRDNVPAHTMEILNR